MKRFSGLRGPRLGLCGVRDVSNGALEW
jgi:hypothetical protein